MDGGYFQINTVHLTRVGLNLRDLLDCRANIDRTRRWHKRGHVELESPDPSAFARTNFAELFL